MTAFFVTRHPGATDWAREQGFEAAAVAHLDPATITPGDVVMGTLPVHIAAEVCARGARYLHLRLDLSAELRGRELTAEDMRAAGATLEEYIVQKAQTNG